MQRAEERATVLSIAKAHTKHETDIYAQYIAIESRKHELHKHLAQGNRNDRVSRMALRNLHYRKVELAKAIRKRHPLA